MARRKGFPTLRQGYKGTEVKFLALALKAANLDPRGLINFDGYYKPGGKIAQAVRDFQVTCLQIYGGPLTVADGEFTVQTKRLLKKKKGIDVDALYAEFTGSHKFLRRTRETLMRG